jgi:hypothetical protein
MMAHIAAEDIHYQYKNMKTTHKFLTGISLFLIAATLFSCSPGGAGLPQRKKMPEFNGYDGIEGAVQSSNSAEAAPQGGFAFATSNVDLMFNGNMEGFLSVALPSAATDSAAVNLINTVKPFALTMLSTWAQQQRHGVVIDLSSHSTEVFRTDYLLQKPNDFSIPVVVMWDRSSQYRVASIKSIIAGVPSVTMSCTSGNDPVNNSLSR